MNPIQQAWLKILNPVSVVINEKLAKRSGLLGKIGRFFLIGPREFGYHPTNQMFIYFNRRVLFATAFMGHKYSVLKGLTHQGYHMLRPMRAAVFLGPIAVLAGLFRLVYYSSENRSYYPDNLDYVMKKATNSLHFPLNTLNQRLSAHYTEISSIYTAEMMKRYHKQHAKIIKERSTQSEHVKKTKYADQSYTYVPMTPVHIEDVKLV
ncbi:unnamed protein product [Paramecium sonneborni]|uniref:Transmembrane protein n=1 Tax=Paramecium sonneborni TaxID=65129 RepID=A0A8S1KF69_9CILI|nr:unnamed protein product [Paramecium sonneborni]